MSADTGKSNCRKFAPNIFNKSKCQTCFRDKDAHTAEALESSKAARKVSKCGYLFVAPDNLDIHNALHRTRRWQRRWFVLYDDGELTFSVDEHPDTIPQGVIDMNKCTEVLRAEGTTGHEFSILVTANGKHNYFKGTSKEEMNWWFDVLVMFPRSLKKTRSKRMTYPTSKVSLPSPEEIAKQQHELSLAAEKTTDEKRARHPILPESVKVHPADLDMQNANKKSLSPLSELSDASRVSSLDDVPEEKLTDEQKAEFNIRTDIDMPRMTPRMVKNRRKTRDHTRRSKSNIDMTHVKLAEEKQAEQKSLSRSNSDENLNLLKTQVSEKNRYQQKTPSQIGSKINAAILSEIEHDNEQYLRSLGINKNTNNFSKTLQSTREMTLETPNEHSLSESNVAENLRTRTDKASIAKVYCNQDKLHVTVENEKNQCLLERGANTVNKQTSRDSLQPSQMSTFTSAGTRIEESLISPNNNTSLFKKDLDSSQGDDLHIAEMERIKDPAYIKKGWLLKQNDKNKAWVRYWFVLKGTTLTYYKDQKSEEQNIADGIIKLHGGDRVGKTDVSKNFGYFIQSKDTHHVLSALTEGIRNNWLQALTGSIEAQKCVLQKTAHSKSIAKPELKTGYSEALDNKSLNERNERPAEGVIKVYTGKHRDKSPKVSPEKDINKNEVMAASGSTPQKGGVMAVANRLPSKDSSANFVSGEKFDSLVPVCIVPPSSLSADHSLTQPEAEVSQQFVVSPSKEMHVSSRNSTSSKSALDSYLTQQQSDSSLEDSLLRRFSIDRRDSDMELDRVDGVNRQSSRHNRSPGTRARSHLRSRSPSDIDQSKLAEKSSQKRTDKSKKELPQSEASLLNSTELEHLESEIQTLRQRLDSVAIEKSPVMQKSSSQSDFRSQVSKGAKEQYWPEKEDRQLSEQLQDSKKLSAALSKQCDVLKQSLYSATDIISKQQNEIRNLHTQHDRDAALLTDKETTISFTQKALTREKEKFVALNQEWEKHVNSLEAQIKTLQTQLYDQDADMKEINERLQHYDELLCEREKQQQVIDEQKQVIDELKLDLTTKALLDERSNELAAEIVSLKNELDSTHERCLLTEGSLAETDAIKKELLKKVQAQDDLIHHQKEQLDKFHTKSEHISELQSEVDDLTARCDELQDDITFKQDELLHVTSLNEALKEDNASVKSTIEKLVKEKNLVQEELESAYSETDKLQICVEELQSGSNEKEQLLLEFKDRLDKLEKRNSELTTLNEKLTADNLELKAKASDHQVRSSQDAELEFMEDKVTAANLAAKTSENDLALLRKSHEELSLKNVQLKESLQDVQEDYRDQIAVMSKRIQELSSQLVIANKSSKQLESQLHQSSMEKYALSREQVKTLKTKDVVSKLEQLEKRVCAMEQDSPTPPHASSLCSLAVPARKISYSHVIQNISELQDRLSKHERSVSSVPLSTTDPSLKEDKGITSNCPILKTAEDVIRYSRTELQNLIQVLPNLVSESDEFVQVVRERLLNVQRRLGTEYSSSTFELGLIEKLLQAWQEKCAGIKETDDIISSGCKNSSKQRLACFAQKLCFEVVLLAEMAHILHARKYSSNFSQMITDRLKHVQDGSVSHIFPLLCKKFELQGEICDVFEELCNFLCSNTSIQQQPCLKDLSEQILVSSIVDSKVDALHEALRNDNLSLTSKAVMQAEMLLALQHFKTGESRIEHETNKAARDYDKLCDVIKVSDACEVANNIISKQLQLVEVECVDSVPCFASTIVPEVSAFSCLDANTVSKYFQREILAREPVIEKYTKLLDKADQYEAVQDLLLQYLCGLNEHAANIVMEAVHRAEMTYVRLRSQEHWKQFIPEKEMFVPNNDEALNSIESLAIASSLNIASIREKYESLLESERSAFANTLCQMQERITQTELHTRHLQDEITNACANGVCPECVGLKIQLTLMENMINEMSATTSKEHKCQKCHDYKLKIENLEALLNSESSKLGQLEKQQKRMQNETMSRSDIEINILKKELQETREKLRLVNLEKKKEMGTVAELTEQVYAKDDEISQIKLALEHFNLREKNLEMALQNQSSGTVYGELIDDRVKQLEGRILEIKGEYSQQMALQKAEYEQKLSKLNEAPISDEAIKLRFQAQIRQLKEMTEKGSTALQVSHRQLIQEIRDRHHQEIEELKRDHAKALAEETAATRSALDAIKREHQEELVKQIEVFKRQYEQEIVSANSSIHEEKLEAMEDEVRLLSEQYSIKCLENASLAESLASQTQRLQDLQVANQELRRRISIKKNSGQTETGADTSTSAEDYHTLQASLREKEAEVENHKVEISLLKTRLNDAQQEYEKDKERHDEICRELEKEKKDKEEQLEKLNKRIAEFGSHRPRSRERTRRFSSSPNDDIATNEDGTPASSTPDDFKRPFTLRTKSYRRSQSMPVCYRYTVDLGPDGWFSLQTPVGIVANRLRYFESNDNDV